MASEILMPKLGLTMKTGTVTKWLKEVGDPVAAKEPIIEMETEKLTNVIEAPADGVLLSKIGVVGERYPIAFVLGYVGQPGEDVPGAEAPKAAEADTAAPAAGAAAAPAAACAKSGDGGRIFISPVARKLAQQRGIDYTGIRGTGPNGRIVKADIESYVAPAAASPAPVCAPSAVEPDELIPYSGMRRAIGENMLRSWTQIPMVTHHVTADAGALVAFRAALNEGVDKSEKVSVNDIIMKITAAALEKMPIMNSSLTDEGIIKHRRVNLGMATAVDNGLIVPVVHNANKKGLLTISAECKELAKKARNGGLMPENIQGGTFTVTNLGGYGSVDSFTPIINSPEAAILGVGRMVDTVVPAGDGFAVHPMITFSLTYDHRIIDGAVAAEFMQIFLRLFANPQRAVLN